MVAKAKTESEIQFDEVIALYIELRNEIETLKAEHVKQLATPLENKEKLAGMLLEWLDATGQTSARTAAGTVYVRTQPFASLGDPDAFIEFIQETGAFELMDRKANAKSCQAYAEENGGLPPGVKLNIQRTVGVRKS